MSLPLLLLGIALVLFVFVDAIWTTLGLHRAGPMAGRVAEWTWRAVRALHHPGGSHRLLSAAGTLTVLAATLAWVVVLCAGWFLVFSAEPASVVNGETREPADFVSRLYFVGYTLVTLGMGDYVPTGGWKAVTVLCSLHGLIELTLAISYLLPVIGAATEARQFASTLTGLGATPEEVLSNAWTGEDFGELPSHLIPLTGSLTLHVHAHQAYPVLHYFHSSHAESAPPLRVAVLDEAATLLRCAVREEAHPPPPTLRALRFALTEYLDLLETVGVEPTAEAPPVPDLRALREAGIPTVSDAEFLERLEAEDERRRLLWGLVRYDGWTWDDVASRAEGRASEQEAMVGTSV